MTIIYLNFPEHLGSKNFTYFTSDDFDLNTSNLINEQPDFIYQVPTDF